MKDKKIFLNRNYLTTIFCMIFCFLISGFHVKAQNNLLTEKTYTYVDCNTKKETFFTVVVPSNGYLTFQTKEPVDTVYKLYNNSNKLLDSTTVTKNSDYKATFSVKKGTYRLGTYSAKAANYSFNYLCSTDMQLDSAKIFNAYPATNKQKIYYKIKPSKDGYLALSPKNSTCFITLCNSRKKSLSSKNYSNPKMKSYKKVVYGVKKGTTYYLKLQSINCPKLTLKYTYKSVIDKSGSKRSKAYKLKSGKKVTGLIIANKKTTDWYKFKLRSPKKIKITLTGSTNDQFYIQIYNSKGESILYSAPYVYDANFKRNIISLHALKKETYYIKIARGNKKSSGYYNLKFK
ncbi:PPC domain-containing protein [Anaerosacchariphilus polymeriproducens]|uniref:Peptidase C-terminal archaeal/bacterial domain-containing protein n=1 Tax=Anaerosacchariphilus polymeriproducens TaxID=1812858 RepID=A0A371AWG6_9FIRM|nr:PPC domain-containing protein [Anaerosacchariphilus polymeriproducens]RDU23926.1 hypothetical protein DWV06_06425 [Anaerosacchariphilus polymeriproducens]